MVEWSIHPGWRFAIAPYGAVAPWPRWNNGAVSRVRVMDARRPRRRPESATRGSGAVVPSGRWVIRRLRERMVVLGGDGEIEDLGQRQLPRGTRSGGLDEGAQNSWSWQIAAMRVSGGPLPRLMCGERSTSGSSWLA